MNIQEIRQKYPQYSDMSDGDLASALHKKYYADMPFNEFAGKIGLSSRPAQVDPSQAIGEAQANPEANYLGMNFKGEYDNGFSPAAAIIATGQLSDTLNQGMTQAREATNYAIQRLLPFGDKGQASLDRAFAQKESEAEKARLFKKLETVNPGSVQIGQIAPLAVAGPEAMLALSAAQYGSPEEKALRVGATLAGNKLAKVAGQSAANKAESLAAAKVANATRDANVAAAKAEGYVALPSEVGGSTTGKILEGASGKIKSGQLASVKSQPVTDRLVRREFGLAEDAPLTIDTMKAVRAKAIEDGYAPLRSLDATIKTDSTFRAEAANLTSRTDSASQVIGDVIKSDISNLVDGLTKAKPFTPAQGIDTVAALRERASDLFKSGDKSAGRAYLSAANSFESLIDRYLTKSGQEGAKLLKGYREARRTIAKTFDAEKAINAGRDGMVNAHTLGKILKKDPGRLSGDLLTVARAANSMPQATRLPQQGWDAPVTALDSWGGIVGSLMAGNPLPFLAPAARVGARYGVLSGPGQRAFTRPNYDPSKLLKGEAALLNNQFAPRAGGLLGYYFASH